MRKISILFVMLWLFLLNSAYAGAIKEEYELQERCKNSVDAWFQKTWGGKHFYKLDKDADTTVGYLNHYNKKLNKCFLLESTSTYNQKRKDYSEQFILIDINENKCYGLFSRTNLRVMEGWVIDMRNSNEIRCRDKGSWDELVKPYMEE
jgi:hypothetical protein